MELNILEKGFSRAANKIANQNISVQTEGRSNQDLELIKAGNVAKGEKEVKTILNSGFVVKNDGNLLLNTYGFIDKEAINNFNGLFLNDNFVEVQGAAFNSMSPYGRNITVKNVIMSSQKYNEINSEKYALNYPKYHKKFNEEYKLSKFTLSNYFDIKKTMPDMEIKNISPGAINFINAGDLNRVEYRIMEIPSSYKFKFNKEEGKDAREILPDKMPKMPELGMLKDCKETADGFRNIKVTVNDEKILEIESIHNWQKIINYVKKRDMRSLNASGFVKIEKDGTLKGIEVHHITQLQDDGKENVRNLIAISENTHRLADSYKILIDKNTGRYREHFFENNNIMNGTHLKPNANTDKLITKIGGLDISDKILLNDIKLDVETNSAMRLNMLNAGEEHLKLLFIDDKTGEELRILAVKNLRETGKNIAKTALINFIADLATSTIAR